MKKIICLIMALVMIFTLTACGPDPGVISAIGGQSGETVSLTTDVKLSATPLSPDRYCSAGEYESIRAAAIKLFKETAALSKDENLLISPVSIMTALAMTAQGAEAETLKQFEEFFGKDIGFLADLMTDYADTITEHNKTAKVYLANSVWVRDDAERLTVEESFLAKCNNMRAEVFKSAFNDGTVRDVNKWVEKNTDGMIDSIMDEVRDEDVIYLINALAFDNEWEHKYENHDVGTGIFNTADGGEQKAEFMYSAESIYLKDDKATGFIKPYKDDFSFVAILPDEGVSVAEYVAGMDENTLTDLVEGGSEVYAVCAGLPKFDNEMSMDMIDVLKNLGLTEMFDSSAADFGSMATSTRGNIYISKVAHKTFIEVNTKGTRAAAVTQVVAADEAAMEMETVILNRPFIYMIVDDHTNESLPLFIGTVESME